MKNDCKEAAVRAAGQPRKKQSLRIAARRGLRGSFTVEAAFLMPVTILLLIWVISLSIDLYHRVDERAQNVGRIEKQDSVGEFRKLEAARVLAESLKQKKGRG